MASLKVIFCLLLCLPLWSQFVPYKSGHVILIIEENRSDAEAMQYMVYLQGLAAQYSQGLQVYSPSHGSWLAYGELGGGIAPFGGAGTETGTTACNGDGCPTQPLAVGVDSMTKELTASGKTWRGYYQSIPATGSLVYNSGLYVRRHNFQVFFNDVWTNPAQANHMISDATLVSDINADNFANWTTIVPDTGHDAHDGATIPALQAADAYLKTFMPSLLARPIFQPGGDGVVIITFDESDLSGDNQCGGFADPKNCGGHIAYVMIGPNIKRGYQSGTVFHQKDILRTMCDLIGVGTCPGDGASGSSLGEFFITSPPSTTGGASNSISGKGGFH